MTAERLLLVRHALAGSRERWDGDDTQRPLDAHGIEQAARLADHLADHLVGPVAVLSSPMRRCIQTVEPLARARGIEVQLDDRLAEATPPLRSSDGWPDAAWYGARGLVAVDGAAAACDGGALVVCSHGEVLPALLAALIGARGQADADAGAVDLTAKALPKGATWVVPYTAGRLSVSQIAAPA